MQKYYFLKVIYQLKKYNLIIINLRIIINILLKKIYHYYIYSQYCISLIFN